MNGFDARLSEAIREWQSTFPSTAANPEGADQLTREVAAVVAPLVEEARAEGYKQGWRAGAKAGYETAQVDATLAIKAIERHRLLMIDAAGRLETCVARADALEALEQLGKAAA
jgi:flagellar biosynthesis/type III secretory pathway protein FliH